MAFNVNEFRSQINKHGLAVNNLFVLTITPPQNFGENIDARDLTFFCRTVNLPDNSIVSGEARSYGYGAMIPHALGMENAVLSTIFMVDSKMEVVKFFHRWQQLIYNYNTENGPLASNGSQMVYELNYKKEYAATISVDVYTSHTPDFKYTYKYFQAYPASVSNGAFSWDNAAEIHTIPVQFRYSSMTTGGLIRNTVDTGVGATSEDYTSAIGGVGQLINNIGELPSFINNAASQITNIFTLL